MNEEKWDVIKKCARLEEVQPIPVGLIVDSPWIPAHVGISTIDYFSIPDIWLEANLKIEREFPQVIFLPGFWVELGMAAEPSGFGCKTSFFPDRTPMVYPLIFSIEEVERLKLPNPLTDGWMPFILNIYQKMEPQVNDAGHHIKVVAARGPLAVASHLVGVTEFLLGLKLDPANTHRLLKMTAATTKNWLEAQANALKEVEGMMVLDDIVGFLSPEEVREFVHPYLKEIFDAFPETVKIFHNDMDNPVSYQFLREWSINIFNFTHLQDISKVRELVGREICLMGNVPPLEALGGGSPDLVLEKALECLNLHPGRKGLILSAGGGVSPGTPGENIEALVAARERFG